MLALALPAGAAAAPADERSAAPSQDLRSPDARDAAAKPSPTAPETTATVRVIDEGNDTLAIALASAALAVALAGAALSLAAIYRRPRPRWTAS
jgi:hypothetical protein